MKVVAINSSYRKNGTTTRLVQRALEGAASLSVETEHILLDECNIQLCKNCLQCYRDVESAVAPCPINDDVDLIVKNILEADGVIFASPVHNGFLTASMVALFERMVWRVCRPTGEILSLKGFPEPRRKDRVRAIASIASAGGIPDRLRKLCDGTPFLKENAPHFLHGFWVGDIYAAAHLPHAPQNDEDWQQIYFLRKLSEEQLEEAYNLGVRMAQVMRKGNLRPTSPFSPIMAIAIRPFVKLLGRYRISS